MHAHFVSSFNVSKVTNRSIRYQSIHFFFYYGRDSSTQLAFPHSWIKPATCFLRYYSLYENREYRFAENTNTLLDRNCITDSLYSNRTRCWSILDGRRRSGWSSRRTIYRSSSWTGSRICVPSIGNVRHIGDRRNRTCTVFPRCGRKCAWPASFSRWIVTCTGHTRIVSHLCDDICAPSGPTTSCNIYRSPRIYTASPL